MQQQMDFSGEQNRDAGIKRAVDNVNDKVENWSENAYEFLLKFIRTHSEFMVEDLRKAAEDIIPDPPSKRAWGAIVVRAKREGRIVGKGFQKKKGAEANCTPAMLWVVVMQMHDEVIF